MTNNLKIALRERRPLVGGWLMFAHTAIAEILATAGFDWVAIDLEHTVIGIEEVQALIQVVDLCGCSPLVRVSSHDPAIIKRVLDAGAHGVIVPSIGSIDEARAAVAAAKYPPQGRRGVGLARAQAYGAGFVEYFDNANERSVVIAQIEDRRGLEAVEGISLVEGIDGLMIGPYDLSCSLGLPGQFQTDAMKTAEARVRSAAQGAGIAVGIHVVEPDTNAARACFERGFTFIAYGADMLFLTWSARQAMASLKAMLSRDPA